MPHILGRPRCGAAITARIERDLDWDDVVELLGTGSKDAARTVVARALNRLARKMRRVRRRTRRGRES